MFTDIIFGANHTARPRRLDRLKPLKSSGLCFDSSGLVSIRSPIQGAPKNPSIVLHVDFLFQVFFRFYVFRFFGLLMNTAQLDP
jgi:hypothetical protein